MATTDKDVLEKIAQMVLYEVPNHQIAAACGVSDGRISQIVATDEFKAVQETLATAHFEEQQLLNEGWDAVEQMSIAHVVTAMQHNPDPEFALRVAAVANKATRRGAINHNPIGAGSAGVRAIIQLNANFVENLQQNFEVKDERTARREDMHKDKKQVNMLGISAVEKLLKPQTAKLPDLHDITDLDLGD